MSETIAAEAVDQARHAAFMGRAVPYARVSSVDASNVVSVIDSVLPVVGHNHAQSLYLWRYFRGDQPILWEKVKEVRPSIDYRIVENHAEEVVDFKVGYQLAEPMQYVLRHHDGSKGPLAGEPEETEAGRGRHLSDINELNTLMFADGKDYADRELFEWMCVCGVGYRMCEASVDGDAPFEQRCLSPLETFVVRESGYRRRVILGVWCGRDDEGRVVYNAWTDRARYVVVAGEVVAEEPHSYGRVPIVEYQLNVARMGVFERVLPLLDAMNAIESNRLDGVEQTVQSLMKFVNCDIDETEFEAMLRLGAVKVHSDDGVRADVDFIRNDLDQSQTQVTKDDLYQAMVNICGMPNRNGTSGSSSDTGAAVLLRDGWSLAESHAKGYELEFKRSEREFLRLVLGICDQSADVSIDLRLRDIELAFNRRNYENLLVKVQALTTMLPEGFHVHPEVAFRSCGLFSDPESAYLESARWTEENRERAEAEQAARQQQEQDGDPGPQAGSPQQAGGTGAQAPRS